MTAAFWLYQLFFISWFTHLTSRFPALGALRLDFVLVLVLVALIFVCQGENRPGRAISIEKSLKLLILYSVLTIPFVEWPGSVVRHGLENFIKAAVFYFFTAKLVRNERQLLIFISIFLGCQTFRILEPLYLHVTEGYWGSGAGLANWGYMDRLSGAPHDIVNPNGLAFIIVITLPFFYYLSVSSKKILVISLVLLPLFIWTLILTSSRTGILALAVLAGLIIAKSRHKAILFVVVIICVASVFPQLSSQQKDRYQSIFSQDTVNAATSEGRFAGIKENLEVGLRRPLFGHGLGTSLEANANFGTSAQPAHNLYAEVFQELGLIGLVLFLRYMYSVVSALREEQRRWQRTGAGDTPFVRATWDAVQVFLGVNLLFSLASYGLSGYEWYLVPGLIIVIKQLRSHQESGERGLERV